MKRGEGGAGRSGVGARDWIGLTDRVGRSEPMIGVGSARCRPCDPGRGCRSPERWAPVAAFFARPDVEFGMAACGTGLQPVSVRPVYNRLNSATGWKPVKTESPVQKPVPQRQGHGRAISGWRSAHTGHWPAPHTARETRRYSLVGTAFSRQRSAISQTRTPYGCRTGQAAGGEEGASRDGTLRAAGFAAPGTDPVTGGGE